MRQVASLGQVASGIFTKSNFTELMRETFVRKGRCGHVAAQRTPVQRARCKRATHT